MALEAGSPAISFTPQVVANAFVKQYYQVLRYTREDAYKFYNGSSILGRTDSNGKMVYVTTIHGIKEQLMSTDFANFLIEIETVDAQPSHVDGVLILVAGYFTTDAVKQKFTQSFFLAPQENGGFYVLNDMFRLTRISTEVKEVVANHDNKSTQITTLPNGEVVSASANVGSPVKNGHVVNKDLEKIPEASTLTAQKAVNEDFAKIPEAAPAPRASVEKAAPASRAPVEKAAPASRAPVEKAAPASRAPVAKSAPASRAPVEKSAPASPAPVEKAAPASPAPPAPSSDEKEVTKKTYASIVKTMRESTQPAPAVRPAKPNPKPKASQNVEKNVSSPSKPAHATDNALPGDKNVPKKKSPDEPGYSIFVKNLPFDATVEMVEQEFSKFGAIKSGGIQVKCQPDQFCFGFVEFETQQSMLAAIEASTVYFGKRESYVEEKRTRTRVVDGVVTHWDDYGNGAGSRFQSGRGGYHGDNYKRQWGGENNGYYHDRDNARNNYSGRGGRGPQGNSYPQNNGYHQNGNGYHQNGNGHSENGYQQRRPNNNNGNGRVERSNGPRQQGPAAS